MEIKSLLFSNFKSKYSAFSSEISKLEKIGILEVDFVAFLLLDFLLDFQMNDEW